MRIELGALACEGIRAHLGGDLKGAVEKAVFLYTGRIRAGRPVPPLPTFLNGSTSFEPEAVIEVELGPDVERQLARAADRQGTTPERLVHHAVLVYLAELDLIDAPGG